MNLTFSYADLVQRVQGTEANLRQLMKDYDLLQTRMTQEIQKKRLQGSGDAGDRIRLETSLRQTEEHVKFLFFQPSLFCRLEYGFYNSESNYDTRVDDQIDEP